MNSKEYMNTVNELMDFKRENLDLTISSKTLMELKKKRESLLELKDDVSKEIRAIELDCLNRRHNINLELEIKENVPRSKIFFNKSDSIPQLRARTMKNLEAEKDMKIKPLEEIKKTVDNSVEEIEDLMIDIYMVIKKQELFPSSRGK